MDRMPDGSLDMALMVSLQLLNHFSVTLPFLILLPTFSTPTFFFHLTEYLGWFLFHDGTLTPLRFNFMLPKRVRKSGQ